MTARFTLHIGVADTDRDHIKIDTDRDGMRDAHTSIAAIISVETTYRGTRETYGEALHAVADIIRACALQYGERLAVMYVVTGSPGGHVTTLDTFLRADEALRLLPLDVAGAPS